MADTRTCPNAVHFSEFQNDPVTGHHYTATCGQTALAGVMVAATPPIESTQDAINLMTGMAREMMAKGWADSPNGATTTRHLHDEALARGFTIASPYIEWQDPIPDTTLHPLMLQYAGVKPFLLMLTNGQALKAVDGSHTEAGLHGHFIAVLGIEPRGYVCLDGDNSAIGDHLPVYPWSVIPASRPTGFLMLEPQTVDGQQVKDLQAQLLDVQTKLAAANAALAVAQRQAADAQAQADAARAEVDAAHMGGALEAIAAMRAIAAALKALPL